MLSIAENKSGIDYAIVAHSAKRGDIFKLIGALADHVIINDRGNKILDAQLGIEKLQNVSAIYCPLRGLKKPSPLGEGKEYEVAYATISAEQSFEV